MPPDPRPSGNDQDPDPAETGGLESGTGVSPGDTPPGSGQMSGTSPDARQGAPNMGPVSGSRTPMIIALTALAVMVIMIAILTGASFFPSD